MERRNSTLFKFIELEGATIHNRITSGGRNISTLPFQYKEDPADSGLTSD